MACTIPCNRYLPDWFTFGIMFSLNAVPKYNTLPRCPVLLLISLAFFISCNEKRSERAVERSFYYWKSVFTLTRFEEQRLDSLEVKTLYIKFFDVDWDEESRSPVPVAKLQVTNNKLPEKIQVIPVVFISNECIRKTDPSQITMLANRIHTLIQDIISGNRFKSIKEIQIDCDWTQATKEKYFRLLNDLKQKVTDLPNGQAGYKLSCTIRLHQIKFLVKTGVPPVDRGLLMCYNMGNLKNPATKNSILETRELKKYSSNLSNYPLPLDLALPLFDWKVLYRNNSYAGLIQNLPGNCFTDAFTKRSGNRYEILKDTLLNGYELRKGDLIRDEQSDLKEILAAANEAGSRLKNTQLRVSLYHLDSVILNKYTTNELESIYNSLR